MLVYTVGSTYFNNTAELHITDGQLLMRLLGNNLLQDFLQALANFSLDKGSGSWRVEVRNTIKCKPTPAETCTNKQKTVKLICSRGEHLKQRTNFLFSPTKQAANMTWIGLSGSDECCEMPHVLIRHRNASQTTDLRCTIVHKHTCQYLLGPLLCPGTSQSASASHWRGKAKIFSWHFINVVNQWQLLNWVCNKWCSWNVASTLTLCSPFQEFQTPYTGCRLSAVWIHRGPEI